MRQRIALAALVVAVALGTTVPTAWAAFGISNFSAEARASNQAGDLESQAGAVPYSGVTDFSFNRTLLLLPDGNVKDIRVDLPAGLVSNPRATPKCTEAEFPSCPASTQLGTEQLYTAAGLPLPVSNVYNMEPKPGQVSLFAFNTVLGRTDIVGGLRSDGDYGLYFTIANVPQLANLVRSVLTFWGKPWTHNDGGSAMTPFITLPTSCGGPLTTTLTVTSWAGQTATATSTTPHGATGCDALPFTPTLAATSVAARKGKPTGLSVALNQPSGQANVRSVSVTLPHALAVRFDTLKLACPEATFAKGPQQCPAGARIGSASATTPLLDAALSGGVYLEAHNTALPSLEVVLDGPGLRIHLTGTFQIGSQITSTFDQIPDLPISNFTLTLDPAGGALSAASDLCAAPLSVSSSIVAQSGKKVDAVSPLAVTGCSVAIPAYAVHGRRVVVTVSAPAAGAVTVSGARLSSARASFGDAGTRVVSMRLTKSGAAALRRARAHQHGLALRIRAAFAPVDETAWQASTAAATVTFPRS